MKIEWYYSSTGGVPHPVSIDLSPDEVSQAVAAYVNKALPALKLKAHCPIQPEQLRFDLDVEQNCIDSCRVTLSPP